MKINNKIFYVASIIFSILTIISAFFVNINIAIMFVGFSQLFSDLDRESLRDDDSEEIQKGSKTGGILSIITTLYFIREVSQSLYTPKNMGLLNINSVQYTLFNLKIDVIQGNFHNLYTIYNYPLIPIFGGMIYNIYILVKAYKNNGNS